jgi:hypothetical protein
MRKVELFSFPISPSHRVFLLSQTHNGVLSLSVIGVALPVSIRYVYIDVCFQPFPDLKGITMPYVVVPNKAEIPVFFNNATNEFI